MDLSAALIALSGGTQGHSNQLVTKSNSLFNSLLQSGKFPFDLFSLFTDLGVDSEVPQHVQFLHELCTGNGFFVNLFFLW